MGATSFTQELTCPIDPARMFKALIVESNTLIPKLLPQFIKSVELVHGDGGAGSIEQVKFHRRNMMIEGDTLGDKLQSINYKVKFEAISDGGSVCKMTSKYNSKKALQVEEEEI